MMNFKKYYGVFLLGLIISHIALAQTPLRQTLKEPYLEIFVISPPQPIKWNSPGKLLKSSLRNAMSKDYAPNGHMMVHLKTETKNILTGVSRASSKESIRITREEKLGLSAMFYTFEGSLDQSRYNLEELKRAQSENRLSSLIFPLTAEKSKELTGFLENYIAYGSFKNYGGGKNTATGEGSGCADFAYQFIKLATDGRIPDAEWRTSVYVPKKLMKIVPGREDQSVPLLKIILHGASWAKSEEDGVYFSTPDPEKISNWIAQQVSDKQFIYNLAEKYPEKKSEKFITEGKTKISANRISSVWSDITQVKAEELP